MGIRALLFTAFAVAFSAACHAHDGDTLRAAGADSTAVAAGRVFSPMVKVGRTVADDGDSIQYLEMGNIYVYPAPVFKNERQKAAFNRLVYNVKKVLPLAKKVNVVIIETYEYLQTLPNDKIREEHMKRVELSLRKQYGPQLKKLTYAQGKLLIKLVYRECNSSTYQLIRAFLGPMRAGFYQAFAWTFGASLTKKYKPESTDRLTERVVRMVEAGQI